MPQADVLRYVWKKAASETMQRFHGENEKEYSACIAHTHTHTHPCTRVAVESTVYYTCIRIIMCILTTLKWENIYKFKYMLPWKKVRVGERTNKKKLEPFKSSAATKMCITHKHKNIAFKGIFSYFCQALVCTLNKEIKSFFPLTSE